ncbi:hypothetical protein [Deinococcus navajonensis]|uniref:Uncharacterized protein n=1 Tax=Deinococcus navajonensis TaxID=309884 RepID=A0ABV8XQJ5_9DEIO
MNAPAWRIGLVAVLMVLWGLLALRFVQRGESVMAGMCLLLLVANAVTLWRLTRHGR